MALDVVDLRAFYASPLGHVARRFIGRAMLRLWPDCGRQRLLGLGFATPYLSVLGAGAERVLAFMPAAQGVVNWPSEGLSASALVEPTLLPLPTASIDRVVLVHALEETESPDDLLEEVARVLSPGGRVLVVAPNRRGLWARMDATPFGYGRPFSRSQLEALMRGATLAPENWAEALYVPPLRGRLFMRSAPAWERLGSSLSLPFAGVHVIDATKQFYQRAPLRATRRSFAFRPVLLPQATPTPTPRIAPRIAPRAGGPPETGSPG
ncbi:class I SAM-dependent methyltransferase [Bosea caraganae]|uniref:Class I SAM-dependent methyltransferase n=1 Tax=Bosea caraganae TaxID=2763117 RepID=A0A370LAG8_9HYPH|nr:class I SAM-dependent methyltransferase [Bosea caraganae]RDJ21800.1 class I SAM-dependent methyltransferase [Bosea caraganae]RDJ28170.1 class I SAM-dependent methyltransferase [Bosea caraganae]